MKTLSICGAAKSIGVSSATIRNWVKAGHIVPVSQKQISFSEKEIFRIKERLATGSIAKLRQRANKTKSSVSILPFEYTENPKILESIIRIRDLYTYEKLDKNALLFLVALRQLEMSGDVIVTKNSRDEDWLGKIQWKRKCVKDEMVAWLDSISSKLPLALFKKLAGLVLLENGEDYLGILNQSLFLEGEKSHIGSYYTPTRYVKSALDFGSTTQVNSFLDPCCGSGKYLIAAVKDFSLDPERCVGFDIDSVAVQLARVNLFLTVREREFTPNIHCCNTLIDIASGHLLCNTNDLIESFDFIATNPPWGAYKNAVKMAGSFDISHFKETFSFFLVKSFSLLKKGGRLSFLLPEAFLNIKVHSEIRKFVLKNASVNSIEMLGRGFSGVFTNIIRLDLTKESPAPARKIFIQNKGHSQKVKQLLFTQNTDCLIDSALNTQERDIIKKIYSTPHTTLHQSAEWALGIVTGNNEKFLSSTCKAGHEPIFRGSEVEKYTLSSPSLFIKFTPSAYQQVAPERLYRAKEKIVYKFISRKLAFAYDDAGQLTLNSANILIPHIDGMSIKVVMAFLNSSLFQYIFEKRFFTHKILKGDIEKLPFPHITAQKHKAIEKLVDEAILGEGERVFSKIDQAIFSCFPSLLDVEIKRVTAHFCQ